MKKIFCSSKIFIGVGISFLLLFFLLDIFNIDFLPLNLDRWIAFIGALAFPFGVLMYWQASKKTRQEDIESRKQLEMQQLEDKIKDCIRISKVEAKYKIVIEDFLMKETTFNDFLDRDFKIAFLMNLDITGSNSVCWFRLEQDQTCLPYNESWLFNFTVYKNRVEKYDQELRSMCNCILEIRAMTQGVEGVLPRYPMGIANADSFYNKLKPLFRWQEGQSFFKINPPSTQTIFKNEKKDLIFKPYDLPEKRFENTKKNNTDLNQYITESRKTYWDKWKTDAIFLLDLSVPEDKELIHKEIKNISPYYTVITALLKKSEEN